MIKEALQFQYIIKLGQMKMMLKNILISFILLICFSFNGYGQIINEIKNSFTANQQDVLQEKLFVHTDKNKYLSGEILWFKIYNVNAENNQPLNTSKVAYVEVLDNNQIPVMQAKVALKGIGSGNGSVYIPVSISSGNYKLRAYTNWMKNFNADNYLEKNNDHQSFKIP
jgi:microcompartment protein CcmK/EutM